MNTLFTQSSAIISPCERFRYVLTRTWDDSLEKLVWLMLNPSKADAEVTDPTITRVRGFSEGFGYGGFIVVNKYAYRTPHPKELKAAGYPVGPDNDRHIAEKSAGKKVVLAWGAHRHPEREWVIRKILKDVGADVYCLGKSKTGQPLHPLMLRADLPLVKWD